LRAGNNARGITSASLINRRMEKAPVEERPASIALHNLVLDLGVLAGPFLGEMVGLQDSLLIAAGLLLLAGILLKLRG